MMHGLMVRFLLPRNLLEPTSTDADVKGEQNLATVVMEMIGTNFRDVLWDAGSGT